MKPFKAKGYSSKEILDLIYTELCVPISTSARGGYECFIGFIDDYSRYGYIYLMHHKSETFDKFKEYEAEVGKHRGKSIKCYDLIIEANTSWLSLGNSSKIMGSHPICLHLACHGRMVYQK